MPPSTLTLTPDLTRALQQINNTGFQPSVERLLGSGSPTVSLKALIHHCLVDLSTALSGDPLGRPVGERLPFEQARRCLKTMRIGLEAASHRPPFVTSLGALAGLKHLISEIDHALAGLEHEPDPEPTFEVASMLAREFQVDGFSPN